MSTPTDERPARFVRELTRLERGPLAQLRRGLGNDERSVYWLEGLYARTGYGKASPTAKSALQTVAGLYALKPQARDEGESTPDDSVETPIPADMEKRTSIGMLMGRLYLLQDKRPSTEKRFLALLDTDRDGLSYHLRQAVTLLATQNLTPDWVSLTSDLISWNDATRRRWAQDFYREISRDSAAKETPEPTPETGSAPSAPAPLFELNPDHQNDEGEDTL